MPLGLTVTYSGNAIMEIVDPYLAPWHRDKAIELLEDSYETLIEYVTEDTTETQELIQTD